MCIGVKGKMYATNLETFIAVADAGSFTRAAEKLYISSTAVIKQINTLEAYLDVPLFERLHRGLLLTEAGKVYYRDAKYMVQYAKDARERARNVMKEKGSVLRIGVSPITPPHIVDDLWEQYAYGNFYWSYKLIPGEAPEMELSEKEAWDLGRCVDMEWYPIQ